MDQTDPNNQPQQVPVNTPPEPTPAQSPPQQIPANQVPVEPTTSNQPSTNEPQVQTFGSQTPAAKKPSGSFRAIFLVLLLLTMVSAGATTYIILNWSQPTQTTTNADIVEPTPTLEDIQNTEVEVNPFSEEAIQDNPFDQTATDSANIFNDFEEESTQSGEEYQNPF